MTKEELEKEAEEYADTVKCEWENDTYWVDCRDKVTDAYLASAEPREKQIQIDVEQIRALQKQNGELADELTLTNNECKEMREELKQRIRENQNLCEQIEKGKVVEHFEAYGQCRDSRRIAELEAQIEKMKCWCNCKNYLSCLEECCRKNISFEKGICYNCKKWELRR